MSAPGSGEVAVRVAVLGAAGRVGEEVVRAVLGAPALELAAAVDPSLAAAPDGAVAVARVEDLDASLVDVAVDFTVAAAARANAEWCAANGVHFVCGTSGLGEDDLARFAELFGTDRPGGDTSPSGDRPAGASHGHRRANAVVAANFAVSAVLMMRLAELAAPFFDGAEIVELHHAAKTDAPSGTAIETARRIAAARAGSGSPPFVADPTRSGLEGARGARVGGAAPGAVHVHAVRLPGLVAHQEVLFGAVGQSLTIRQDSYDRTSFMPGVLLAVREVAARPGLTIGLEPLLGI